MKKLLIAILVLAVVGIAAGCGERVDGSPDSTGQAGSTPSAPGNMGDASLDQNNVSAENQGDASQVQNNVPAENQGQESSEGEMKDTIQATITMEDGGVIVLELYPEIAPQSVRNFVYLARQGFYGGLKFHRIIKGFMIQGGCPDSTGAGGPGYSIKGEFAANGFANDLSHTRGVLSMARTNIPDTAGSQFFIVHETSPHLDGQYAAFGAVTSGMDVVDRLAETPVTDGNGSVAARNMPVIKTITIDDDIELPEPDKLPR